MNRSLDGKSLWDLLLLVWGGGACFAGSVLPETDPGTIAWMPVVYRGRLSADTQCGWGTSQGKERGQGSLRYQTRSTHCKPANL